MTSTAPLDDLLAEVRRAQDLTSPATARSIRQAAGVSQERLAAVLGVHHVTLGRWEAGTHRPRAGQLARWADALDALRAVVA